MVVNCGFYGRTSSTGKGTILADQALQEHVCRKESICWRRIETVFKHQAVSKKWNIKPQWLSLRREREVRLNWVIFHFLLHLLPEGMSYSHAYSRITFPRGARQLSPSDGTQIASSPWAAARYDLEGAGTKRSPCQVGYISMCFILSPVCYGTLLFWATPLSFESHESDKWEREEVGNYKTHRRVCLGTRRTLLYEPWLSLLLTGPTSISSIIIWD